MRGMGRLALHKHTKIQTRRKRYAHSHVCDPISSILDNQLFQSKVRISLYLKSIFYTISALITLMSSDIAGVAYIVSIIGCMAYNYMLVTSQ